VNDGARYASVAIPVPLRRLFTYSVPPGANVRPGSRVRAPFGHRDVEATVVELLEEAPQGSFEIKSLREVARPELDLSESILALTRFVADYYLCSWGEAIEAALPPAPKTDGRPRHVRRSTPPPATELSTRATAQRRVLGRLPSGGSTLPLQRIPTVDRTALRSLIAAGWAEWVDESEIPASEEAKRAEPEQPWPPTPGQQAVLGGLLPAVERGVFAPYVLFGATGSGKTEVYLRAAAEALERGRTVLYLVPEIGLTPLLVGKIERRFPGQVAVLHSALPRTERFRQWQAVRRGRFPVVLGTRSAVFAPLAKIGLVVVDEEQDGSYKQQDAPRYNGRDVALVRARAEGAVVLLGSATPSMESFQHARAGRYGLLRLGGRVEDRPLPPVEIVDMRKVFQSGGQASPLSPALIEGLRECLDRGEQALILRNRRGWAMALLCPACGSRVECDRCSIAMTWHRAARRLRCHTCADERPYPELCPTCGEKELKPVGEGTEQLEGLLRAELPQARIERMDRDTIRRRGEHERMLHRFDRGEIDVLVGTQMIAKGHDFPRVTLVGVLSADQSLGLPDYRAGERTFQLLTQVAGRAGRGERPGRVLVQAFDAEHPILALAATQDYEAFFDREIRYRRALRYPPLAALVQLIVQHTDESQARLWGERIADAIREVGGDRLLLAGPGPAPIERIKDRYRQQILVRTAGRRRLVQALDRALASLGNEIPRRSLVVDVDPIVLL